MNDLTYWLVRHADGERYLSSWDMRSTRDAFGGRWSAFQYPCADDAREDAQEKGGTVVRVTVRRIPRRTLVERLDAMCPMPIGEAIAFLEREITGGTER